jgi:predicted chitinase
MPITLNSNIAFKLFEQSGGDTLFPNHLKQVLEYAQNDDNISNKKELAYLLATAKSEGDYSLTRWESDFLCGDKGVPYVNKPCQRALDYYRSSDGKTNYYSRGVDKKGVPYFGRGLIQLTHKYNYDKYGKLIGVNLVEDGDRALQPENSYKIASEYLKRKTYKYVNGDNLTQARKSVNGGTSGVDRTNAEYYRWLNILEQPMVNFKYSFWTKKNKILVSVGGALVLGLVGYLVYKGTR